MKITVELSAEEMNEIIRFSGLSKKGPAVRKLLLEAMQIRRRGEAASKFLTGEWAVDLDGFEATKAFDHCKSATLTSAWRSSAESRRE